MNVFEKYIENVKENEKISEIIDDLCIVHFNHCKNSLYNVFDQDFVKLLRWEINTSKCPPVTIKIYYIALDLKDGGKEKEFSKEIEWKHLLIKVDGYE